MDTQDGDKYKGLARIGGFCPNEECPDYGRLQKEQKKSNITKFGKTKAGRQRYRCNTYGRTFTEIKGTIFSCKRTEEAEILETLALIAEGSVSVFRSDVPSCVNQRSYSSTSRSPTWMPSYVSRCGRRSANSISDCRPPLSTWHTIRSKPWPWPRTLRPFL